MRRRLRALPALLAALLVMAGSAQAASASHSPTIALQIAVGHSGPPMSTSVGFYWIAAATGVARAVGGGLCEAPCVATTTATLGSYAYDQCPEFVHTAPPSSPDLLQIARRSGQSQSTVGSSRSCVRVGVAAEAGSLEPDAFLDATGKVLPVVTAAGAAVLGFEGFELESTDLHLRLDLIVDATVRPLGLDPSSAISDWPADIWVDVALKL